MISKYSPLYTDPFKPSIGDYVCITLLFFMFFIGFVGGTCLNSEKIHKKTLPISSQVK